MKPIYIGKKVVLLTEDYLKLTEERNRLRQQVEDMFNGKRCERFRIKDAETKMLQDSVESYQKLVRTLEKENQRLEHKVRELCAEIVTRNSDERRIP